MRPVGNQCEEGIKLLAEEVCEKFPIVKNLLLMKRYVNDLGDSLENEEKTDSIIKKTTEVLQSVNIKCVLCWNSLVPSH